MGGPADNNVTLETKNLSIYYGDNRVVHDVNLGILANQATAVIGPSGCGKSTLLRTINRMNDFIPGSSSHCPGPWVRPHR